MANGARRLRARSWRSLGLITFALAALLLLSMGGAIVAAPVTLPLMFLASRRHATRVFRLAAVVLGGLTAAEVLWALTYLWVGEAKPWIWLLPLGGGIAAAVVFLGGVRHRRASGATA